MNDLVPTLTPPETKPNVSVARIEDAWYVACTSRELKRKPLKREVLGIPLVLFRGGDGAPAALLDRCPHRNVPLSLGRVAEGRLQCRYHGWEFDGAGICRHVPGLCGAAESPGRRAPAFATREQDGYVWIYATPDVEPESEPYRPPHLGERGYASVQQVVRADATLHATIENALDVPHTAYLHAGLFRGSGERNEIEAVVRRGSDVVECEYVGEPRPSGIAGRILAPGGGVVQHWDRFRLPSVAEVEYRIGDDAHLLVSAIGTPNADFRTTLYATVSFRLRIPAWLIRPILTPVALWIFRQDAWILRQQTETIRRFGGEQYASTDLDTLGGWIRRLLRQAERGERREVEGMEEVKRVRMEV
ncbi:MAG: Rieske 2Fe-2S domain-containing protein [Myxococcota bacterium]